MRMIGHVTPTPTSIRLGRAPRSPPSTDHTNGLWPWALTHGWKWSEIDTKSKPSLLGPRGVLDERGGPCSSLESV